jgi:tetratricopeptide (TPR) repeat protein
MGMAETLITKLCSIRQIVVRPMGAVRKFTDPRQDPVRAGQELDVETVLAGSIQKAGDRVRVTVQLMNVRTGASLWAAQFDTDFRDIFQVQDSISERVAHALTLRLSGEESARLAGHYTENPEAYQLYLQGQYLLGKQTGDRSDNLRRSLEFYRLAVDRDPKFARAFVGIAEFYISAGDPKLAPRDSSLHARSAVVRALELDDTLAEAHNALAELKYQYEFDWSGAEAEFKRAIDLEPNVAYFHIASSWNQMCQGRFDQAQAELARAVELEPGSLRFNKTQGVLFIFMRRYDEAINHYKKMREVEPTLIHRNQFSMAVAFAQVGMRAEAVEELLEDGRTRGYLTTNEIELLKEAFRASGWEAYMRMTINLLEEKAKREYISPTILAGLYALSGRKEPALAWLEKAIDIGDPWISLIKIQPAYDSLRSDPRFRELLFRVGLQ